MAEPSPRPSDRLALGRSILSTGKVSSQGAAEAFDEWMRAKPVDIGNTVRRGIVQFRRTGNSISHYSEHDAGNGACMRVLPVALTTFGASHDVVNTACCAQSHVTHNNDLSDAATACVVKMIHSALDGASMVELLKNYAQPLVQSHPLFKFRGRHLSNPSGFIVHTLQVVFQSLFDTESFDDCLIDVVNRGGDSDTTGAIAGMIAGAVYGPKAIPRKWTKALDRDVRIECEDQASRLIRLAFENSD